MNILEKNLAAILPKNKSLYECLQKASANNDYVSAVVSKTGQPVPVFKDGHALHSKYNPERETASLFSPADEFILFCGIGAAIHIAYFLKNFPEKKCAVTDITTESLKSLLCSLDVSAVLADPRVFILPPVFEPAFTAAFFAAYQPVRHGDLRLITLRPWENFYAAQLARIHAIISAAVQSAQTDFATQAHFGKVWMKNIIGNLQTASRLPPLLPALMQTDRRKTALICGAGPSLTDSISRIKKNRSRFVIFASDTAFLPLLKNGIEAEFFLSVDPQLVSLQHFTKEAKHTIGVFDLCALSALVRIFRQNGNRFMFTASHHPLVQYASRFGVFPFAESGSGTVALYALDVAHRLGFSTVETAGLDFCYTGGKAYANGTYFEKQIARTCTKLFPDETFFSALMFRTAVQKQNGNGKINYTNELLLYYRREAEHYRFDGECWESRHFAQFDYASFIGTLIRDLRENKADVETALLPFAAYCKKRKKNYSNALAIKTILKYNESYE